MRSRKRKRKEKQQQREEPSDACLHNKIYVSFASYLRNMQYMKAQMQKLPLPISFKVQRPGDGVSPPSARRGESARALGSTHSWFATVLFSPGWGSHSLARDVLTLPLLIALAGPLALAPTIKARCAEAKVRDRPTDSLLIPLPTAGRTHATKKLKRKKQQQWINDIANETTTINHKSIH